MNILMMGYMLIAFLFLILSFGFVDPNLHLSTHPLFLAVEKTLMHLVYQRSYVAALIYTVLLIVLFVLYGKTLSHITQKMIDLKWRVTAVIAVGIFLCAYPALSYDIFNYILTAKVAFFYQENPYVVMPIEIIGEPMLAFTRAANKLALYGPVWLIATYIPHVLSHNNIILAIYSFKLLSFLGYIGVSYLIFWRTKSIGQVAFFALNPLVIIETLVNGHNDAFMMLLAIAGLLLVKEIKLGKNIVGWLLLTASVLVKGATIAVYPVIVIARKYSFETYMCWVSIMLFGVFLLSPLREEMYPWYATWFIATISFISIKRSAYIHTAIYWLSFGLMLRYIPWIATREYGGSGPTIRFLVTWIPLFIFSLWHLIRARKTK